MLETAQIGKGDLVLDLAPGTGYSTAVIARMAEAVVAIEADETLFSGARRLIEQLEIDNAVVSEGDPAAGDPAHGPFDVIFINGAVEEVPAALTGQLKEGGRLVAIFRDGEVGQCRVLVRIGQTITERYVFDATAPLLAGFGRAEAFTF